MEEMKETEVVETEMEKPAYQPRPVWQRVLAWIGLVIVVVSVILYYIHIANGGM